MPFQKGHKGFRTILMKGFINIAVIILIGAGLLVFAVPYQFSKEQIKQESQESPLIFGAPVSNLFRNLLPSANQTYDLGSTTPAAEWKNVFTQNLTVSGTCTGCGSSGGGVGWASTTASTESIYFYGTGNVGIGTTSPYAKLSVEHLSTTGTVIGPDALTGFTGNLLDLKVASTTKFVIGANGATTTGFAISSITSSLLKTDSSGNVLGAVAGTDYVAGSSFFSFPFTP